MDRRVKKTQAAIRNAFIELIKEKGDINTISIKEIVDRADISRSTFYTHYTDIIELTEDLSDIIAKEISNIVIETHKKTPDQTSYTIIYKNILQYLYDLGPLTKAVIIDAKNWSMIEEIINSLQAAIAEFYKSSHKQIRSEVCEVTATFWTNGCMGLIREWAKNDFNYSVDEMAKLITKSIETCSTFFLTKA